MKYQEPENEILRRRRRGDKVSSGSLISSQPGAANHSAYHQMTLATANITTTPMPSISVKSQQHHSSSQYPALSASVVDNVPTNTNGRTITSVDATTFPDSPPSRRLSTPYLLHGGSGILSASLQLPVHLQLQDKTHATTLNLSDELPDIPFIEDASYGSETSPTDLSM